MHRKIFMVQLHIVNGIDIHPLIAILSNWYPVSRPIRFVFVPILAYRGVKPENNTSG